MNVSNKWNVSEYFSETHRDKWVESFKIEIRIIPYLVFGAVSVLSGCLAVSTNADGGLW